MSVLKFRWASLKCDKIQPGNLERLSWRVYLSKLQDNMKFSCKSINTIWSFPLVTFHYYSSAKKTDTEGLAHSISCQPFLSIFLQQLAAVCQTNFLNIYVWLEMRLSYLTKLLDFYMLKHSVTRAEVVAISTLGVKIWTHIDTCT